MTTELVSTIVLNWNNKDVIFDCLDSLLAQTYPSQEIIVVDNGSTDGSTALIHEKYQEQIKLIKNTENLGFSEGMNIGIKHAKGAFIAILNSDAMADKNWLVAMMAPMGSSPKLGMCACKIYLAGKKNILDNTGEWIYRDGLNRARGRLEEDTGQYDHSKEVLCPSGCAALFRKEMLEKAGAFDKHFFAYGEDLDIGLRGRIAGYDCIYLPDAIVTHRLSTSSGAHSSLKAFYVERNRLWVAIKCFPLRHLMLVPFYTVARYSYLVLGMLSGKGPAAQYQKQSSSASLFWILCKAYGSTFQHLAYLLGERKKIFQNFSLSSQDFSALLKKHGISARDAALSEVI